MNENKIYEAVVIGTSAGGLIALQIILSLLTPEFSLPILIVQHLHPDSKKILVNLLADICKLKVKEAYDKEKILPGTVYIAPPDYHLMIEDDRSFSLALTEPVNFARPSINVLFETAAEVYRDKLIGIILTGANDDGSQGIKKIKELGGLAIVQNPDEAEEKSMPEAAIKAVKVDFIMGLKEIGSFLNNVNGDKNG
ncbi:chemotaxis protein CheB [Candidatus Poribacteria bacterium]|nr:chemotaxis protein CheB [Candidatus Poribacteria bacterium]